MTELGFEPETSESVIETCADAELRKSGSPLTVLFQTLTDINGIQFREYNNS